MVALLYFDRVMHSGIFLRRDTMVVVTHEGTAKVKRSRLNTLCQEYEVFNQSLTCQKSILEFSTCQQ